MLINKKEVEMINHTVKLYVAAERKGPWDIAKGDSSRFKISVTGFDMASMDHCKDDYISIMELDVVVQVPDISGIDFTNIEIEILEGMKKKIQAKCQVDLDSIDSKINSLLAIEHQG